MRRDSRFWLARKFRTCAFSSSTEDEEQSVEYRKCRDTWLVGGLSNEYTIVLLHKQNALIREKFIAGAKCKGWVLPAVLAVGGERRICECALGDG